jgi:hypothetical protein
LRLDRWHDAEGQRAGGDGRASHESKGLAASASMFASHLFLLVWSDAMTITSRLTKTSNPEGLLPARRTQTLIAAAHNRPLATPGSRSL